MYKGYALGFSQQEHRYGGRRCGIEVVMVTVTMAVFLGMAMGVTV